MSVTVTPGLRLEAETRELPLNGLTPARVYRALRGSHCGALIESAATPAEPRHAFIALDPLHAIAIDDETAMLESIRRIFSAYRDGAGSLPHDYGFVGAFAYDAALRIQGIDAAPRRRRLFSDAFGFFPGTWLSFDDATNRIALTGIFRSREERDDVAHRLDEYAARIALAARGDAPRVALTAQPPPAAMEASLSRAEFVARVVEAQRAILRGDVYQLVLSIRFSLPFTGDALSVYDELQRRNPSPYAFLIERNGRALLGASPEFLVRLRGDRAELRPLAGTRPRGFTPDEDRQLAGDLLNDLKERAEHAMLVDLGRNDLSHVCRAGSVRVEQSFQVEYYSHVMHLATTVSGRLAGNNDAFDLFAATFPAGTVTGAPKRRAMELIRALEPVARDVYAGSVVHFRFDGSFDAALTLRSIVLDGRDAIWQAGAGIVNRSDPESEYAEVLAKSRIARTVLGIER